MRCWKRCSTLHTAHPPPKREYIPQPQVALSLLVAGEADPVFHLIEVVGEGAAAGGGEAVFGVFECAGVDAEVSVGGFEDTFEVGEAEAGVGGESADDPQADAFVNEAVELGELGSGRWGTFASRGRGFRWLATLGLGSSHRASGR